MTYDICSEMTKAIINIPRDPDDSYFEDEKGNQFDPSQGFHDEIVGIGGRFCEAASDFTITQDSEREYSEGIMIKLEGIMIS